MGAFVPTMAAIGWGVVQGEQGWHLLLVNGDEVGPIRRLPGTVVPSLLARFDALAALGYAVVRGGPDAWAWREEVGDDGRSVLGAMAYIRPLTDRDVAAAGSGRTPAS